MFGFSTKRSPEHTGLLGTRMNQEVLNKIANTPAYARATQFGYPEEYLRSTTKAERKAEQDLATKITRNEQHEFFIESLDKYSDILAKDFGLNINQLGVRDACRQALIDKGMVNKGFAKWALNYKPDRSLPKNYKFKALGNDYYKWRNENKKALENIDYSNGVHDIKLTRRW